MSISYNQKYMEGGCPTNASEELNITVPVVVRGVAEVGDVTFSCMGTSVVTRNSDYTPGSANAISRFTISQRLRVDIPVLFGAEADVGEGYVEFASSTEKETDECKCAY